MKEYKTTAHINSLKGERDEITVLEKVGDNDYIVDYKGVKCHALFNWFVCEYYADDVYRRVEQWELFTVTELFRTTYSFWTIETIAWKLQESILTTLQNKQ